VGYGHLPETWRATYGIEGKGTDFELDDEAIVDRWTGDSDTIGVGDLYREVGPRKRNESFADGLRSDSVGYERFAIDEVWTERSERKGDGVDIESGGDQDIVIMRIINCSFGRIIKFFSLPQQLW
jgi:hypothetical protein